MNGAITSKLTELQHDTVNSPTISLRPPQAPAQSSTSLEALIAAAEFAYQNQRRTSNLVLQATSLSDLYSRIRQHMPGLVAELHDLSQKRADNGLLLCYRWSAFLDEAIERFVQIIRTPAESDALAVYAVGNFGTRMATLHGPAQILILVKSEIEQDAFLRTLRGAHADLVDAFGGKIAPESVLPVYTEGNLQLPKEFRTPNLIATLNRRPLGPSSGFTRGIDRTLEQQARRRANDMKLYLYLRRAERQRSHPLPVDELDGWQVGQGLGGFADFVYSALLLPSDDGTTLHHTLRNCRVEVALSAIVLLHLRWWLSANKAQNETLSRTLIKQYGKLFDEEGIDTIPGARARIHQFELEQWSRTLLRGIPTTNEVFFSPSGLKTNQEARTRNPRHAAFRLLRAHQGTGLPISPEEDAFFLSTPGVIGPAPAFMPLLRAGGPVADALKPLDRWGCLESLIPGLERGFEQRAWHGVRKRPSTVTVTGQAVLACQELDAQRFPDLAAFDTASTDRLFLVRSYRDFLNALDDEERQAVYLALMCREAIRLSALSVSDYCARLRDNYQIEFTSRVERYLALCLGANRNMLVGPIYDDGYSDPAAIRGMACQFADLSELKVLTAFSGVAHGLDFPGLAKLFQFYTSVRREMERSVDGSETSPHPAVVADTELQLVAGMSDLGRRIYEGLPRSFANTIHVGRARSLVESLESAARTGEPIITASLEGDRLYLSLASRSKPGLLWRILGAIQQEGGSVEHVEAYCSNYEPQEQVALNFVTVQGPSSVPADREGWDTRLRTSLMKQLRSPSNNFTDATGERIDLFMSARTIFQTSGRPLTLRPDHYGRPQWFNIRWESRAEGNDETRLAYVITRLLDEVCRVDLASVHRVPTWSEGKDPSIRWDALLTTSFPGAELHARLQSIFGRLGEDTVPAQSAA